MFRRFDRPSMVPPLGHRKEDIDCRAHSVTNSGPEKCLLCAGHLLSGAGASAPVTIPTKRDKSRRSIADAVALVMPHDVGHGASMEQAPVGHPVVSSHVTLSLSYNEDIR